MENKFQRESTESPELNEPPKDSDPDIRTSRRSRRQKKGQGNARDPRLDPQFAGRPPSELSERVGSEREISPSTDSEMSERYDSEVAREIPSGVPKVGARGNGNYPTTPSQKVCLRGHSTKQWSGSMCRCKNNDGTFGCAVIRKTVIRNGKPMGMLMCPKCGYTTPAKEE